jgi:iron complex transport system substrate-binding protein
MSRRLAATIAALALGATLLAGCGQTPSESSTPPPAAAITVTDQAGRTVTLAAPATSVVALTASDIEILYAIGAGGAVAGRGEYCDWPAEALEVAVVNSGSETNVEQIIALEPELVILATMAQDQEQIAQLEAAGITVAVTEANTIAETYDTITLIGTLMGREAEAGAVIADMKATFQALSDAAGGAQRPTAPTIYFEVSPLEWGLWAAGSGTFMDEVADLLHLDNIFGDVTGWAEVDQEQVIARNPDYILTVTMYFGEGPTPAEEIMSRTGWDLVTAVQDQAILNLTGNELSRPGPRLADGAQALFDFVYGG